MMASQGRGRGKRRNNNPIGTINIPGDLMIEKKDITNILHSEAFPREHEQKSLMMLPEELGIQLKRKLAFTKFPERPGFGTLGKRIKLVSNCFSLKVPSGCVYHYDVTVTKKQKSDEETPEENDKRYRCLNTRKNREIIKLMLDTNPIFRGTYAAYDGQKNIYARNMLKANFPITCEIVMPNENSDSDDTFIVQIKPAYKEDGSCSISLDLLHAFYDKTVSSVPREAIMALETILRQGPCLQFTPIGRSFFYPPNPENLHPLGGGLEIWFGYHQSIRLGQWGPMVNLNRTATSFHQKGPVLSLIADMLNTSVSELRRKPYLPNTEIKRISHKLKNIKIEVTHLKNYRRKYRAVRLTKENANQLEFDMIVNGRVVKKTVAAYFKEQYGRNLEFPNLPCLLVQPESKKTYIPIEVCEIVAGQHSKKKLDSRQTAEMIRFTAALPKERFSDIKQIAANPEFNNDVNVRLFGLEVSREPIKLEGQVLDSPTVCYRDGETIKPSGGFWSMREKKYLVGATINSWVLLSFAHRVKLPNLKRLNDIIVEVGNASGMSINNAKYATTIDPSRCDIKNVLSHMKSTYNAELAVIVLPADDKYIYGRVKHAAETIVGLKTQCIKENNVTNPRKLNPLLVSNLCLKINTKAGGENNSLKMDIREIPPILFRPVIIIGADVNHPGVSDCVKPSLAACVASLNMRLSRYAVTVRAQINRDEKKQAVETILDLKNMVSELLRLFYKQTKGKKPEKIIFYRDGVSEGQFETIKEFEVTCIREACRALQIDYEPGITFIVVQKRHHVRFLPQDPKDGAGIPKNVPPGTIVDTAVTDPVKFDFYLCSHLGMKGTSRPSHYTVLEDDNNFTANDLQKFTYQLCYSYARCTRSISIPIPVAYADLAAYRARQHLEGGLEETSSSSESSGGSDYIVQSGGSNSFEPLSESVVDSVKVIEDLKTAMYYV